MKVALIGSDDDFVNAVYDRLLTTNEFKMFTGKRYGRICASNTFQYNTILDLVRDWTLFRGFNFITNLTPLDVLVQACATCAESLTSIEQVTLARNSSDLVMPRYDYAFYLTGNASQSIIAEYELNIRKYGYSNIDIIRDPSVEYATQEILSHIRESINEEK